MPQNDWIAEAAGEDDALVGVLDCVIESVKEIAEAVERAPLLEMSPATTGATTNASGDEVKALDVVANDILKSALLACPSVSLVASEEEEDAVLSPHPSPAARRLGVAFDPLDGSRNVECHIPVGTIFAVFASPSSSHAAEADLASGANVIAAGYALYSSSTVLVLSVGRGQGTAMFVLSRPSDGPAAPSLSRGRFLACAPPRVAIPPRGQIYSVNDARYFDWPRGLQRWVDDSRRGLGPSGKQYSARYVCSLVADVVRSRAPRPSIPFPSLPSLPFPSLPSLLFPSFRTWYADPPPPVPLFSSPILLSPFLTSPVCCSTARFCTGAWR